MDAAGGQLKLIGRAVVVVVVVEMQVLTLIESRLVKAVPLEQVPPVT